MDFRIADTFTDSLTRLTRDEQKAVKTTAFDLQLNPANPGMQFHKLDRAKDANFWSVRVNADIRIIVHKTNQGLLLCYVDHHDAAYRWAERRKIERHPKTGAAQLVEIRETIREIEIPRYIDAPQMIKRPVPNSRVLTAVSDETLLSYGVPQEWLADVQAANEDTLLMLCDHLPREAAEAVLELATGGTPVTLSSIAAGEDAFAHPDSQRRFRVMTNVEELQRALEYPWDKWAVFLHPAQRELVERQYNGPVRVSGSAGTGKTIVALHRAAHLARTKPEARVLLTTLNPILATFLRQRLKRLIGSESEVWKRVDVFPIDEVGRRAFATKWGDPRIASGTDVAAMIREAVKATEITGSSERFVIAEWTDVVDAWQLVTWEQYRDVTRLGRKTRLSEKQRLELWTVFERVRDRLAREGLVTKAGMFAGAEGAVIGAAKTPYTHAVVDEAQDVSLAQLRLLCVLAGTGVERLFFTGDLGQRIFQTPFSWKSLGVDIRGRSYTLRVNYRTSHQIRRHADQLLPTEMSDVDDNAENRRGTVSVFNGPSPTVCRAPSVEAEIAAVAKWIRTRTESGIEPAEIGVFVRSSDEFDRALRAVAASGNSAAVLSHSENPSEDSVTISTMHVAKGLEYRAAVVMAADETVVPLQSRIESVGDQADLEEVYSSERHLLYVACTRAREHLLVSGVAPVSEFLDDFRDVGAA